MFKAVVEGYRSVKEQAEAAKSEVSLARTAAAGSDVALSAATAGVWAALFLAGREQLGKSLNTLVELCDRYAELADDAADIVEKDLIPKRDAVLEDLGAAAGTAGAVMFDESADLSSRFLEVETAVNDFKTDVLLASGTTVGLPDAALVTSPLMQLSGNLAAQKQAFSDTSRAFTAYRDAVSDFETSTACDFVTMFDAVETELLVKGSSSDIKLAASMISMMGKDGQTGLLYAMKNGGDLSSFLESFKSKGFLGRLGDDISGAFKYDNWIDAYDALRGIETDKFDGARKALASGADDFSSALSGAGWLKRLGGAADLLGYVGDVLDIAETGGRVAEEVMEGDYGGAAGELAYGAVKFFGGKAVSVGVGFAIGGPVGAIAGAGVGVLWDWGCEVVHDGKVMEHIDAFVNGAKDVFDGAKDMASGAIEGAKSFFTGAADFFGGLVPSY